MKYEVTVTVVVDTEDYQDYPDEYPTVPGDWARRVVAAMLEAEVEWPDDATITTVREMAASESGPICPDPLDFGTEEEFAAAWAKYTRSGPVDDTPVMLEVLGLSDNYKNEVMPTCPCCGAERCDCAPTFPDEVEGKYSCDECRWSGDETYRLEISNDASGNPLPKKDMEQFLDAEGLMPRQCPECGAFINKNEVEPTRDSMHPQGM